MSSRRTTPPRSVFSRSTNLLGLAGKLAGKELSGRIKGRFEQAMAAKDSLSSELRRVKTQIDQAKEIVKHLGQLKGAAMKTGQILSLELRDYLPPEVIEVLSSLQSKGDTVDFSEIESILIEELGPDVFAELKFESREPVASASIGQVHRLNWRGQDVALKVQFRGISETIDSDVAMLQKVISAGLKLSNFGIKDISFEDVFFEIREVLKQETDYLKEAESLNRYRNLAKGVSHFRVPETLPALTTGKVLGLTFEEGIGLDAWLKATPGGPTLEARQRVGHLFLDLYFKEFFEWGYIQTDPNFGNFLLTPVVDPTQMILLDFGATREYPLSFRRKYVRMLLASEREDDSEALSLAYELELLSDRESDETKGHFLDLLSATVGLFSAEIQPFDFKDREYIDGTRRILFRFVKGLQYSPPPRSLLFLNRKLAGIYAALKSLGLKVDLRPYWASLKPLSDRWESGETGESHS